MSHYSLGIDIGNTESRIILMRDLHILDKMILPLSTRDGYNQVIGELENKARSMIKQRKLKLGDLSGIGIGFGGPVDAKRAVSLCSHHAPGWEEAPLKTAFEARFNVPVLLENDANLGAWGEYVYGYRNTYKNILYMTIGTGVGGGLIIEGRLYRGQNGLSGEIGHINVVPDGPECTCGNRGCLEALISGPSIAKKVRGEIMGNPRLETKIRDFMDRDSEISSETVYYAARENDPFAIDIWREVGRYLALGLCTVIHLLDPEAIILGGGVTKAKDFFISETKRIINEDKLIRRFSNPRIYFSQLGDFSVAYGAANLFPNAGS